MGTMTEERDDDIARGDDDRAGGTMTGKRTVWKMWTKASRKPRAKLTWKAM